MFHTVSPQFSLFGMPLVGCVWFCLFWVVFCFLCCFEWLPALPRRRSFLPDLMTVRAVMVRAALEEKKKSLPKQNKHKQTNKKQPKANTPKPTNQRASQKARPRVKRCETCGNATLKLSNVLLQEVVPNIVWFCPKLECFQLPAMHLSHISKHFRKGGFLLRRAAFIHLILRISTWAFRSCGAKSLVRNKSGLTLLSVPLALLFCGWP